MIAVGATRIRPRHALKQVLVAEARTMASVMADRTRFM